MNRRGTAGVDLKWGVRPSLTFDATVNTDFAQVEADEEQVNLTRFDLFFPEKRPFFLENASTFQFGQPQSIDLFFSRRIGLSSSGRPIDIVAGSRLSGKLGGGWNVGFLNIQTDQAEDASGARIAPATNFSVFRAQKEVGRSTYGAIFVGKYATDDELSGTNKWNRAYGADADVQVSDSQRASFFIARTDSPGETGSDQAGRAFYNFTNNLWQVSGGLSQVGDRFNPEVGLPPSPWVQASRVPRVPAVPTEDGGVDSPVLAALLEQRVLWPGRHAADVVHPHAPVRDSAGLWRTVRLVRRPQSGSADAAVHGVRPRRPAGRDSAGPVHVVAERARVPAQPERAGDGARAIPAGALLRRRLQLD